MTWRSRRPDTTDVEVSGFLFYRGEQVTLSVNVVRDKIVWLVSAVEHFERPMGLPSAILWAQSVEELLQVLVAAGWHTLRFGSR